MSDPPSWMGPIRQSAFIVADLETAIRQWIDQTGTGPWFVFDVDVVDSVYRGTRVPMRSRTGLAQSGGQQIELIQPDLTVNSVYKEFLDAGATGIHHICYWSNLEHASSLLAARGCELLQSGVTPNGAHYAYWSSTIDIPYLEFVDPQPGDEMATFFDRIATAALDWDGTDPIRGR